MSEKVESVELEIEELAGDDGVGHHSGVAVFVPLTVPGDRVVARVGGTGQGRRRGTLVEILESGEGRVSAKCTLFGECGGCSWQVCRYDEQLKAKARIMQRAFRVARVGGFQRGAPGQEGGGGDPLSVKASPDVWGYRRKVRAHWIKTAKGVVLGFKGRRSRRIVDIGDGGPCVVLRPELRGAVPRIRRILEKVGAPHRGEVSMLVGKGGRVHTAFSPGVDGDRRRKKRHGGSVWGFEGEAEKEVLLAVEEKGFSGFVFKKNKDYRVVGERFLSLEDGKDRTVLASAACFVQANANVNESLQGFVRSAVGGTKDAVFDLYAGAGNFTVELLNSAPVLAAEWDREAVLALLENKRLWSHTDRLKVWSGAAEEAVNRAIAGDRWGVGVAPDVVVVDPPRRGCRKLLKPLVDLSPRRIVYVSCDSMTCARDVAWLLERGYRMIRLEAFDTMPHTPHFELGVILEKSSE